ncbi:MAG: 2-hydroxyacid dehydrogenase [Candidatus Micrarchaeota archaeon]
MKFRKLVLYDLSTKPLEKELLKQLKQFAYEVSVVSVPREYCRGLKPFHLRGADALVTRLFDFYDDRLFEKSNLKYVGAMHTDVSHFNLELLKRKGISLCNVPEYSTESTAELTISALLNISRQTHDAMNFVKQGNWGFEGFLGWELKGKTLGVIGLGKIGGRVAELAQCFGMKVIYYSRSRKKLRGTRFVSLEKLLKESEVVSLHCSLSPQTRNLLNCRRLALMKKGAVLLDSARSELVDLNALHSLCKRKRLYAWFEAIEDAKTRAKFRKLDNVYLTPHFGWATKEAQQRLRETTLANIKAFLNQRPQNTVE